MTAAAAFAVLLFWARLAALAAEIMTFAARRRHGPLPDEIDDIRAERTRRGPRRIWRRRADAIAAALPLPRRGP